MERDESSARAATLARVLLVSAAILFVLGALCDPALVAPFHFRSPLSGEALAETRRSRLAFGASAGLLALAGLALYRLSGPARWLSRGRMRWLLALLSAFLPLLVLERGARPFVERLTTLFEPDAELGWKHRPLVRDTYWGAQVRINAHGMRGPEREPAKPPGVRRVLVLGDSVVFGLALGDDADTLPERLEHELETRTSARFECLNAAVSGWAPFQQLRFLERECERWQPDLVVLGFVLNDVVERFGSERAGATGPSVQLAYSRPDGLPAWLAESGLYLALRELHRRHVLAGSSKTALAHQNRLTPYHVIFQSDSDPVQAAWKRVLPELDGILAWCRARSIPLALVVFPFAIQLLQPDANAPQWILESFARRRQLPCLDLLPPLLAATQARGLKESDLFLDGLHPTALGNRIAAEELARFLIAGGLVP